MRIPAAKFAVPFKSPCMTNSSQTSSSSQPLPESTNQVPLSSDQQRKQKRRCKDILSGLSQDSNICTQTFTTPIAYSPVATQSTTKHSALLSRTPKRCKLSRKDDLLVLTNAPPLNNLEVVAKQIGKHRRDKSTKSTNVNCTDVIQTGKKEVEAKRKTKHPKDAPVPPSATHNDTIDKAACPTRTAKPTADTVQTGPDVYEFFLSPTSQRKQRQKIRRLQARVSKFSKSVYYSISYQESRN